MIAGLRKGAPEAYTEAMRRYGRLVASVVASLTSDPRDVEELVQDTFVRAFSAINSYRPDEGTSFQTWLARIAYNGTVSRLRRRSLQFVAETLDTLTETAIPDDEPDLQADTELLAIAVAALPPPEKLAVTLVYFNGLTINEAATVLQVAPRVLSSRLYRIRKKLASTINDLRKK